MRFFTDLMLLKATVHYYTKKDPDKWKDFWADEQSQADDLNLNYKLTGKTSNFVGTSPLMGNMDIDGRRATGFQF